MLADQQCKMLLPLRSRRRDRQHRTLHVLDVGKEPVPFRLISGRCPIQQRVDGLVSKAQPTASAQADGYVPLRLQADEQHQHIPVFRPDVHRVFPVVLWLAALGDLRIGFEVGDYSGVEFPSTPSVQALR